MPKKIIRKNLKHIEQEESTHLFQEVIPCDVGVKIFEYLQTSDLSRIIYTSKYIHSLVIYILANRAMQGDLFVQKYLLKRLSHHISTKNYNELIAYSHPTLINFLNYVLNSSSLHAEHIIALTTKIFLASVDHLIVSEKELQDWVLKLQCFFLNPEIQLIAGWGLSFIVKKAELANLWNLLSNSINKKQRTILKNAELEEKYFLQSFINSFMKKTRDNIFYNQESVHPFIHSLPYFVTKLSSMQQKKLLPSLISSIEIITESSSSRVLATSIQSLLSQFDSKEKQSFQTTIIDNFLESSLLENVHFNDPTINNHLHNYLSLYIACLKALNNTSKEEGFFNKIFVNFHPACSSNPVRIKMGYHLYQEFKKYGYDKEASQLIDKFLELIKKNFFLLNDSIWSVDSEEFYHSLKNKLIALIAENEDKITKILILRLYRYMTSDELKELQDTNKCPNMQQELQNSDEEISKVAFLACIWTLPYLRKKEEANTLTEKLTEKITESSSSTLVHYIISLTSSKPYFSDKQRTIIANCMLDCLGKNSAKLDLDKQKSIIFFFRKYSIYLNDENKTLCFSNMLAELKSSLFLLDFIDNIAPLFPNGRKEFCKTLLNLLHAPEKNKLILTKHRTKYLFEKLVRNYSLLDHDLRTDIIQSFVKGLENYIISPEIFKKLSTVQAYDLINEHAIFNALIAPLESLNDKTYQHKAHYSELLKCLIYSYPRLPATHKKRVDTILEKLKGFSSNSKVGRSLFYANINLSYTRKQVLFITSIQIRSQMQQALDCWMSGDTTLVIEAMKQKESLPLQKHQWPQKEIICRYILCLQVCASWNEFILDQSELVFFEKFKQSIWGKDNETNEKWYAHFLQLPLLYKNSDKKAFKRSLDVCLAPFNTNFPLTELQENSRLTLQQFLTTLLCQDISSDISKIVFEKFNLLPAVFNLPVCEIVFNLLIICLAEENGKQRDFILHHNKFEQLKKLLKENDAPTLKNFLESNHAYAYFTSPKLTKFERLLGRIKDIPIEHLITKSNSDNIIELEQNNVSMIQKKNVH